jgi:hypothetical protein
VVEMLLLTAGRQSHRVSMSTGIAIMSWFCLLEYLAGWELPAAGLAMQWSGLPPPPGPMSGSTGISGHSTR